MTTQKTDWILKTDRKDAQGKPAYVSKRAGESITYNPGHARTWTTQTGAMRWANNCGWSGHVTAEEREGVWI